MLRTLLVGLSGLAALISLLATVSGHVVILVPQEGTLPIKFSALYIYPAPLVHPRLCEIFQAQKEPPNTFHLAPLYSNLGGCRIVGMHAGGSHEFTLPAGWRDRAADDEPSPLMLTYADSTGVSRVATNWAHLRHGCSKLAVLASMLLLLCLVELAR